MTRRVALVGSTASGKSSVAMHVADEARGRGIEVELVSVDSMQVYRGMDIGTAKPTAAEQAAVRHHCIDLVDASDEFTVGDFKAAHDAAIVDIGARGASALLVGGTGLYHRVVIDDFDLPGEFRAVRGELDADPDTEAMHERLAALDPLAASRMEPGNRRRVVRALEVTIGSGRPFSSFGPGVGTYEDSPVEQIGLRWPRSVIAERITARVHSMLDAGLVDEVAALHESGMSRSAGQALGYKEIVDHLDGRISKDEAIDTIITRTRQFAVRQDRWFRRDPRVRWIDVARDPVTEVAPVVMEALTR
ncbi:MAG: tRNA (adenosine(37)-N6)-dimethylallyltransferase MiaA [Ilumatobacter sp.]|uniref:tRNA (adenosine(37)-N6)-dimethylallyltransferase MiaA n=1 Tax=Ilumatobacter sp. TaxID=1967498 RepID=UPI003C76737E